MCTHTQVPHTSKQWLKPNTRIQKDRSDSAYVMILCMLDYACSLSVYISDVFGVKCRVGVAMLSTVAMVSVTFLA